MVTEITGNDRETNKELSKTERNQKWEAQNEKKTYNNVKKIKKIKSRNNLNKK